MMNATSIESPKPFDSFDGSSFAAVMSTSRLLRSITLRCPSVIGSKEPV